MPIVANDIDFHGSGGTGETVPDNWIGGVRSNTEVTDNSDNNLFDDISGDEASIGDINYRGIYVRNAHGSLTLTATVIWIESNTTSADDTVAIAAADEGLNATMETIANETTVPATVTFTEPANKGAGVSLGNIPTVQHFGVWIRRDVDSSASAIDANEFQLKVEGDTSA